MMRALTLLWICGSIVACRGTTERGQPAAAPDKAGAPAKAGGRLHLVYELDLDSAVYDRALSVRRDLEAAFADQKISAIVQVSAMAPGELAVIPRDGASRAAIEQLLKADYRDTIASRACEPAAGPNAICFKIASAELPMNGGRPTAIS